MRLRPQKAGETVASEDELVPDRSGLFPGEMFPKPLASLLVVPVGGEDLHKCPYCNGLVDADRCDAMGADLGCVFCELCGREFRCD